MSERIIRYKTCPVCSQEFQCPKKIGLKNWTKRKYCSKKCSEKNLPSGENATHWKGDDVGYWGIHAWMKREFNKPSLCEHCGTTDSKKFEWANISGEYKRDRNDFIRLCARCHDKFDEPWKKRSRDSLGRFA